MQTMQEFIRQGRSNDVKHALYEIPDEAFRHAIEVELEHTRDRNVAAKIAADHFSEHGVHYYPVLEIAEDFLEHLKGKSESEVKLWMKRLNTLVDAMLESEYADEDKKEDDNEEAVEAD